MIKPSDLVVTKLELANVGLYPKPGPIIGQGATCSAVDEVCLVIAEARWPVSVYGAREHELFVVCSAGMGWQLARVFEAVQ